MGTGQGPVNPSAWSLTIRSRPKVVFWHETTVVCEKHSATPFRRDIAAGMMLKPVTGIMLIHDRGWATRWTTERTPILT